MQRHEEEASPDSPPIEATAWQMWVLVYKTCGWWVALRTAVKYGWMRLRGQA